MKNVWHVSCAALEQAGMVPAEEFLYRYPHDLSGGQRAAGGLGELR